MHSLLKELEGYFETTPQEQLDKDWEEIKELYGYGLDVEEYANRYREYMNKE